MFVSLTLMARAITGAFASARVAAAIYAELPPSITKVDVIIARGGTAGSILASRLAETDQELSILVIEEGDDSFNVTKAIYPALFERNTLTGSDTALFWKANKSPQLAGREPVVETGGILGGGTSINWMVYTRGQWDDFDSWNTSGWTAEDVLPYLIKTETYHGATTNRSTHGYSGPIHVSKGTHEAPRAEEGFIRGAIKAGFEEIVDLQSLHSNNGSGPWYRHAPPDDGRRQDVGHCYLYPLLQSGDYPNLHVLVKTQVLRVLFDDAKRAFGVEFRPNPNFGTGNQDNKTRSVRAKKLVVASAASFGTLLLLERSVVGDPVVLKNAGVPLLEPLPGVGNDLQDHHFVGYVYRTSLAQSETINAIARNERSRDVSAMIATNDPQLGWNGHDTSSKVRPSPADVAALGPEFQAVWDRDFKDAPNRPLMIWGLFNAFFGDASTLPEDAKEHIHLTGPSIDDAYDFDPGWLLDENDIDLKSHIWGYKAQRRMARRMDIFRGELATGHPKFAEGSNASVITVSGGPIDHDIEYSAGDDAAIVQYIRENLGTSRHPLGTCKMAPREATGVVDANLNVYGVTRLKIADLSVPPQQVAANTYNTALMLREKAADIVIEELDLKHVTRLSTSGQSEVKKRLTP